MLTSSDIKNVNFSASMRGYKIEEVETFLDKIEADYLQFERIINDYKEQISSLQSEIDNFKSSQESIQNVLINAQKLADQIVCEAKEKSEEIVLKAESNINTITQQEKELAFAFEQKANERKIALQKELDAMTEKAKLKAESIMAAANDSVKRQQILFEKIKLEIANFKSSVTAKYKEHLSILQEIPDTVEKDPQKISEIISAKIDEVDDINIFIAPKIEPSVETFPVIEAVEENPASEGFVIDEDI